MKKKALFKKVDCLRFFIPDLEKGLEFYHQQLGLNIIWKTDTAIGLGITDDVTEIVIHNEREGIEIDLKVDDVVEAIEKFKNAGGTVVYGPFEIKIGKCALVKDPWGHQYVFLDSSKGVLVTDSDGNIIGQK